MLSRRIVPEAQLPHCWLWRRCQSRCALLGALVAVVCSPLVARESGTGFLSPQGVDSRRVSSVPRRQGLDEPEPRFSRQKLRAEADDPFIKTRVYLFGAGAVFASIGFLFILPRFIGSLLGAPNASPLSSVVTDLAINATGAGLLGWLAYNDLEAERRLEQRREEGGLIARAQVQLKEASNPDVLLPVSLSDLRAGRQVRALRPVVCMGTKAYCDECAKSLRDYDGAMNETDFLVVLVPFDSAGEPVQDAELVTATRDLRSAALSRPSQDWEDLYQMQMELVGQQEKDGKQGLVMIVKKNGSVGMRFLGIPNWAAISDDVQSRRARGLDTTNV